MTSFDTTRLTAPHSTEEPVADHDFACINNGSQPILGRSGGVAERVGDAVAEPGAEFSHLGLSR